MSQQKRRGGGLRDTNLLMVWGVALGLSVVLIVGDMAMGARGKLEALRRPAGPIEWAMLPPRIALAAPFAVVGGVLIPVCALVLTIAVRRERHRHRARKSGRNYIVWWDNA